jgi:hypothetical protein
MNYLPPSWVDTSLGGGFMKYLMIGLLGFLIAGIAHAANEDHSKNK